MDIICDKCNSKFKIPDGKIPPGKTAYDEISHQVILKKFKKR